MLQDTYIDVGGSPYGSDIDQQPWEPLPSYDSASFDDW